ncbi:hypothetical protein MCETHM1_03226 [Flavobacteriaceae bacterium]
MKSISTILFKKKNTPETAGVRLKLKTNLYIFIVKL